MQTNSIDSRGKQKPYIKLGALFGGILLVILAVFEIGLLVGQGKMGFSTSLAYSRDLPADLDYSSVEKVYDELRANYDGDIKVEQLLDGMKTGLAEATGDPYTVYFNAKDAEDFNKQLNGTFSGIGAELGQDANKNLIIVAPIAGFPAAKAGLRPQDIVVSIDGKSTAGFSTDEAVTKIRGPKGTQVKLGIVRDKKEELNFTITREDIKVPSVKHEILDGNIGYLQISQFNEDTTQLATEAAQEFKDKHVKGVVVDVRGNPGGLLTVSVDVASLWLPKGATVVQERRGSLVTGLSAANGNNILEGVPTAVLIDAGSASASEILAGALKDNKAATLFGIKSFGKGSAQQIQNLPGGGELKVTIARWYRPNGQNVDKKGIAPDTEIKMTDEDYDQKRDPQKDAAIQFIKK